MVCAFRNLQFPAILRLSEELQEDLVSDWVMGGSAEQSLTLLFSRLLIASSEPWGLEWQ